MRQSARAITVIIALALVAQAGCVRRTIMITSDPDGALVYLNDVEVGRTPVEVDFLYYGTYDVRLVRDGYEPLMTSGEAKPPWWDNVPIDLLAEAAPGEPHAETHWHYDLEQTVVVRQDLIERARSLRERSEAATAEDERAPAPPVAPAPPETENPAGSGGTAPPGG